MDVNVEALDRVVDLTRAALVVALKLALPLLGVGLVVGLVVSLFQAVTQIQEQTLTFIPKILAVVGTLIFLLPTLLMWAVEYALETLNGLHRLGGG